MIQSHDMRVGMSVRPKTEITPDIEEIIRSDSIDLFLVMTV